MISIIVPVYRVESYLSRCVDSLLAQTYTDLEIILIDDGSPDNSSVICDEYARQDARIRVIHQENAGLSAARNVGMRIASGEYIGFVDSDDYVAPQMYEKLLLAIERHHSDIAMCGCRIVSEDGSFIGSDKFEEMTEYHSNEIITKFILPLKTASWNKLYRASSIKGVEFPYGRIHGEDLVFIMSALTTETTLTTTSYLGYNYIKRDNSITTSVFKPSSFDEVWCKDEACSLMTEKFPAFEQKALQWSLRSRMNILRKIIKSNNLSLSDKQEEYKCWIKNNRHKLSPILPLKWEIELFLLLNFKYIYRLFF